MDFDHLEEIIKLAYAYSPNDTLYYVDKHVADLTRKNNQLSDVEDWDDDIAVTHRRDDQDRNELTIRKLRFLMSYLKIGGR